MMFVVLFLLSLSSAVAVDVQQEEMKTMLISDLLLRLSDVEERLSLQEKINNEQAILIRSLIKGMEKVTSVAEKGEKMPIYAKDHGEHGIKNSTTVTKDSEKTKPIKSASATEQSVVNKTHGLLPKLPLKRIQKKSFEGTVAFFSSTTHSGLGNMQTVIFDKVITNIGGSYNHHTGIFTSPDHGVYTFSWTFTCKYLFSHLVVNSNTVHTMSCSAEDRDPMSHTNVVVIEINQGDVVHIRLQPYVPVIFSLAEFNAGSFCGWKLH